MLIEKMTAVNIEQVCNKILSLTDKAKIFERTQIKSENKKKTHDNLPDAHEYSHNITC